MSKHTPGPWTLGDENNHGAEVEVGGTRISLDRADPFTGTYVISREELLANTRLVMSAPDLLAALEMLAGVVGEQDAGGVDDGSIYALAIAQDAIAKARGTK